MPRWQKVIGIWLLVGSFLAVVFLNGRSEARLLSAAEMRTVATGGAPGACTQSIASWPCRDFGGTCYTAKTEAACKAQVVCGGCSASGVESVCRTTNPLYYIGCEEDLTVNGCGYYIEGAQACAWDSYCQCTGGTVNQNGCSRINDKNASTNCIPVP